MCLFYLKSLWKDNLRNSKVVSYTNNYCSYRCEALVVPGLNVSRFLLPIKDLESTDRDLERNLRIWSNAVHSGCLEELRLA